MCPMPPISVSPSDASPPNKISPVVSAGVPTATIVAVAVPPSPADVPSETSQADNHAVHISSGSVINPGSERLAGWVGGATNLNVQAGVAGKPKSRGRHFFTSFYQKVLVVVNLSRIPGRQLTRWNLALRCRANRAGQLCLSPYLL